MIRSIAVALTLASILACPGIAAIQPGQVQAAGPTAPTETMMVTLANFSFTPSILHFERGRHYLLRLTNQGSGGHNFTAKAFFAATTVDPASQALIVNGGVEVPKGGTVEIGLTPAMPGEYPIKCSHFLHSGFGMKGSAVIE